MKTFVKAVLITTILAVLTRALGLIIKIYLSRIIGAEALGYYQIALSVFFLLCTLVTSGIPLVISRLCASKPTKKPQIVFCGLIFSNIIAFVVCLFVVLFPFMFTFIWGQNKSLSVLLTLLPSVLFTSLYVPFRGAFWGSKEFFTLGFIELLEQIFRFIALIIFFSLSFSITGENIAGITYSIACTLSSIIAIIWYFIKGNKIKPNLSFFKQIAAESAPIAIARIGSSISSLLISIILPLNLCSFGLTQSEAIGQFGVVTGMILPLITIPGTLISSISVALIPDLSSSNTEHIKKQINNSLSYSIIISVLLLPTFGVLGETIGRLLFNDELAGKLLKSGSILLLPLGLSQISSSILNAIGKEKRGLVNYILGAISMLICVIFLPKYLGIYALIVGFFIMSIITTILNLVAIKHLLSVLPLKTLLFSAIISIVSALFAHFSFGIVNLFLFPLIAAIIASIISVTIMIILYQTFNIMNIFDFLPNKFRKKVNN